MPDAPRPGLGARERIRREAEVAPRGALQDVAAGLALLTAASIAVVALREGDDSRAHGVVFLPGITYAVAFAWAARRVRAFRDGRIAFRFAYAPVILQAGVAAVFWGAVAARVAGHDSPVLVAGLASWVLLLVGWVLFLPLLVCARRAGPLLLVSGIGAVWFGIMIR